MNTLQRMEVRGKEAVARVLVRHLSVPQIYFDARWPLGSNRQADLLAIDRAGTGDVHVVEVRGLKFDLASAVKELMGYPAQFRWLASLHLGSTPKFSSQAPKELYPTDGMGRIGVIEIIRMANDELGANIRFKAERFPGNYAAEVDRFVRKNAPDIEFR